MTARISLIPGKPRGHRPRLQRHPRNLRLIFPPGLLSSFTMKEFKLCGLGNAVVDIFLEVSDFEFASLGFERGGMRLVDLQEQKVLLDRYQKLEPKLVSGGSVANSVIAFSQLGGQSAFIGCVGDD